MRLKSLEIVLLHYSIHFVQCISATHSETAPEHDPTTTTTTMFDSWNNVLRFESLTFSPLNIVLPDHTTFLQKAFGLSMWAIMSIMITNKKLRGHGLVKLNDIQEPSATLINDLGEFYIHF